MEYKPVFMAVDTLLNENISAEDIEIIKTTGIFTVAEIRRETRKKFASVTRLSLEKVDQIKKAAEKLCCSQILSSDKVWDEAIFIVTGVQQFDQLLSGGLKSKQITEVFGKSSTVQFLLSHVICITSQLIGDSQIDAKIAFLDISSTYSSSSIECIAQKYHLNVERVVGNIVHIPVTSVDVFNEIMMEMPRMLYNGGGLFNLVIISSFSSLFSCKSSSKKICIDLLSKLHRLSEVYNFAIFVTSEKQVIPNSKLLTSSWVKIKLYESQFGYIATLKTDYIGNQCVETYFSLKDFGIDQQ